MKEKIKNALINEYRTLGLGEKVIDGLTSFCETSVETEEDIEAVVKSLSGLAKSFQSEADQIRTAKANAEKKAAELQAHLEQFKQRTTDTTVVEVPKNDYEARLNELKELFENKINATQTELQAMKSKEEQLKRDAYINAEALRLGIPQTRLDEGIYIAPDADEAAITAKLQQISNNVKALSAPQTRIAMPTTTAGVTITEEERAEILKRYKH